MGECPKYCRPGSGVSSYGADAANMANGPGRGRVPKFVIPPMNVSVPAQPDLPRNTGYNARTNVQSKILARYGSGGTTGTFNLRAFVTNPSARFRLKVVVCFEPDAATSPDPAFVVIPTWSITAMSRNPESGKDVPLQKAYPSPQSANTTMPLPDAYEMDTAANLLRVDVTLTDTNFSAAYVAANSFVNCVLYATWEPDVQLPDEERDFLYTQCSVTAPPVRYIANTAT